MKKSMLTLGLVAACAFALTGCVQEIEPYTPAAEAAVSEAVPYELVAGFDATKTTIDDNFKVAWAEGDAINVFHAVAGTTDYINDGKFTVKAAGAKGVFAGELAQALDAEKSYDWYIVYPYSEDAESPANCAILVSNPERTTDAGNSVLAELPLYGVTKALSGKNAPTMDVHHLMSAMKVTFVNVDTKASVKYVRFQNQLDGYCTENISEQMLGSFYVDFTAEQPEFTTGPDDTKLYSHSTANITNDGTLEVGQSVSTFLIVKPMTLPAGRTIVFAANNFNSMKVVTLKEDLELKAGEIQDINVNLGTEWISADEAAEGILFRFCMKNSDNKTTYGDNLNNNCYGGLWAEPGQTSPVVGSSKKNAARFFSVRDHFSYYKDASEYFYGSAWISTGRYQDKPECANSTGRYFLPGMSFDPATNPDDYYLINAKYAELKAGSKVTFKTSFMVNAAATPKDWEITYSVDGGNNFLPATIAAPYSLDTVEGNKVSFNYPGDRACHPVVITCPIAANVENADFQIKIQPVAATFTEKGMFSFAPYYEMDSDADMHAFAAKSYANYFAGKPVAEYIPSMVGEASNANWKITNVGDYDDIAACAILKVE